jgi:hypothetical protein
MPAAGTELEVTGPLGQVNGLLELRLSGADKNHSVRKLSTGRPLPEARLITAAVTNDVALAESIEGSHVTLHDVTLDTTKPDFSSTSATYLMRGADGAEFPLRVDSRTDINGQAKPIGPFDVSGILSQSHTNTATPPVDGWFLLPTRFADLVPKARPPKIDFTIRLQDLILPGDSATNNFTEQCLRMAETLVLSLAVSDPDGDAVSLDVAALEAALPPGAVLTMDKVEAQPQGANTGTQLRGVLTFTAAAVHAGRQFVLPLEARDPTLTNRVMIAIYVPTVAEQWIAITEFLANPTSDPAAATFNPLSRAAPADNPSSDDEFVELVNLGPAAIDLRGWTFSDAQRIRHEFGTNALIMNASAALVVFGGPGDGNPPQLTVPAFAASSGGLSLNNTGDSILVRNAASNLVARVVFSGSNLAADGSLQRTHDDGVFAGPTAPDAPAVSPGLRTDGSSWSSGHPPPPLSAPIRVIASSEAGRVSLSFNTEAGHRYSVLRSSAAEGPFLPVATGLDLGAFEEVVPDRAASFYRVSSP